MRISFLPRKAFYVIALRGLFFVRFILQLKVFRLITYHSDGYVPYDCHLVLFLNLLFNIVSIKILLIL